VADVTILALSFTARYRHTGAANSMEQPVRVRSARAPSRAGEGLP